MICVSSPRKSIAKEYQRCENIMIGCFGTWLEQVGICSAQVLEACPGSLFWVVARLEDDILPARRTRACQMQSHAFLIASSRCLFLCRWASQSSGSAHKYKYISTYIYKSVCLHSPLSLSLSVPSSLVLHTFVEFVEACCCFFYISFSV